MVVFAWACGSGDPEISEDGVTDEVTDPAEELDAVEGEDITADDGEADVPLPPGARLHGVVWGPHPDGTDPMFPVSGALVAALQAPPGPIPDHVYCETCVELDPGIPNTLSNPDGTFMMAVPPGGHYTILVQKGQFRRVREYDAPSEEGDYDMLPEMTTLPSRSDPVAGDTIPRMAVVYGDYDHIEDVLAKVGIGDDDDHYGYDYDQLDPAFDMYDNGNEDHHGFDKNNLLNDLERMRRYHIIFFNCSYNANFSFMGDETLQERLRTYVSEGGKLYVSDYAMPVVEQTWPEFMWFNNPISGGCSEADVDPPTCNHGPPFDAPSNASDEELNDWLDAQGLLDDGFMTLENWDTIGDIFEGDMGRDPDTGEIVRDFPHVWVEGPWHYDAETLRDFSHDPDEWDYDTMHPFTLSFQYGCGRVLFTTYHTVGTTRGGKHPGLYEQELTLFYLIMEIGVCQDQPLLI